jgi:hypothetical protein
MIPLETSLLIIINNFDLFQSLSNITMSNIILIVLWVLGLLGLRYWVNKMKGSFSGKDQQHFKKEILEAHSKQKKEQ